jgi:Ser/Thr protein kinase RdoA (MazF antagonist)
LNTATTTAEDPTPRLTIAAAASVLESHFGLTGAVSSLPSERDQNFAVDCGPRGRFVLKIANSREARAALELQNAVLDHVGRQASHIEVPRVVAVAGGSAIVEWRAATGATHCVRLLTWLDGELLVRATPHDSCLLASLGTTLASLDAALLQFSHPAMHRELHWDLMRADLAFRHASLLDAPERALVATGMRAWQAIAWPSLRRSVIHGDANDYNVLVRDGRVVGLLDFGDMVHTATVCELAIALAYVMLGKADPLAAALPVIAAYCARLPLTMAEAEALYPLTVARLCMSVCHAAYNARAKSDDPYQQVTATPARELLAQLATNAAGTAAVAFREACTTS